MKKGRYVKAYLLFYLYVILTKCRNKFVLMILKWFENISRAYY